MTADYMDVLILNPSQLSPRAPKIFLALMLLCLLTIVGSGLYAWIRYENFPAPPSHTPALTAARPYLFDVVLVDGAVLESAEIAHMVRPMRMVLQRRLPGMKYHARIFVYGAGPPMSVSAEKAVAGFNPEDGSFLVDMRILRSHKPLPGTRVQWWASWMGHEAMHLVQKERGHLTAAGSRGEAYNTDPIELEAATEGASVANSLGFPIPWTFAGQALQSEDPWVYWPYVHESIPDEIRVSTASTRCGTMVRAWEWVKAPFAQ